MSHDVIVAGRAINAMPLLEKFLEQKGKHSIIRKVFAPIWVNGPVERFVSKNVVTVGDAAGQSKPTTAFCCLDKLSILYVGRGTSINFLPAWIFYQQCGSLV